MLCEKCGRDASDSDNFCAGCGDPMVSVANKVPIDGAIQKVSAKPSFMGRMLKKIVAPETAPESSGENIKADNSQEASRDRDLARLMRITAVVAMVSISYIFIWQLFFESGEEEQNQNASYDAAAEKKIIEAPETQASAIDATVETPKTTSEAVVEAVTPKQSNVAQENGTQQESVIDCKSEYYDVRATKEVCNQVVVLDSMVKDKIDDNGKDMIKCIKDADEAADRCYQDALAVKSRDDLYACKKELDDVYDDCEDDMKDANKQAIKDLGDAIDKIIE